MLSGCLAAESIFEEFENSMENVQSRETNLILIKQFYLIKQ